MKFVYNSFFQKIAVVSFAACLWTFSLGVQAEVTLKVGWDEWAPHQTKDASGNLVGANIELISTICKKAGFGVEFSKMPWKRNLEELKSGNVDIAMSASKTEEREKFAYFSDSFFKLEYNVLFVKKEEQDKYTNITSLKDIIGSDFKLGITRGSIYSDEHEALSSNPAFTKQVQPVVKTRQNIDKLMAGRIHGFVDDELSGVELIKEMGLENRITIHFYLYGEKDASSYLMFSKKSMSSEQVNRLNQSLSDMKADGSYQKILQKYKL